MNEELPKDIGGYQAIEFGNIKDGDIWVEKGSPTAFVSERFHGKNVETIKEYLGEWFPRRNIWIYRKMPCPCQSDDKRQEIPGICYAGDMLFGEGQGLNKAKTDDEGKAPLAYLPWAGINEVAQVQAYGHKKYKDFNNYRRGMEIGRNLSCAIRHISAFMEGQDLDNESGRSHLAHAACRLLFTLQNIHDQTSIDDRFSNRTQVSNNLVQGLGIRYEARAGDTKRNIEDPKGAGGGTKG